MLLSVSQQKLAVGEKSGVKAMLAALSYRVTSECEKTNGRDRIGDSMVIKCVSAGSYQTTEEVNMKLNRSETSFHPVIHPRVQLCM